MPKNKIKSKYIGRAIKDGKFTCIIEGNELYVMMVLPNGNVIKYKSKSYLDKSRDTFAELEEGDKK